MEENFEKYNEGKIYQERVKIISVSTIIHPRYETECIFLEHFIMKSSGVLLFVKHFSSLTCFNISDSVYYTVYHSNASARSS